MYEVKIKKLDNLGNGIGYLNNKIIFIPKTLPEDIVLCEIKQEKSKYYLGKLIEIKEKSNKRIEIDCPYFNICGGCHLRHMSYQDTLEYKRKKVKDILNIDNIEVIENKNYLNYRNKITLKVKNKKIGFYEEKTNDLIEIDNCLIASMPLNNCLKYLDKLNINNGDITLRCNSNEEVLIIIKTKDKVTFKESDFKDIKLVGVVLNDKTIYGENYFYERIHGSLFKISYDAFFQVNYFITNELFNILESNLEVSNCVIDLYSGVGTLGIIASNKAKKVYSIEVIKNAVLDNVENVKLNKKNNIYPMLGDVSKVFDKINESYDTLIIDPPRVGIDKKTIEILLNSEVKTIIYISCDIMTLKRDLDILKEKYELKKYYLLDMFSYSYHLESFCVLTRK